MELLKVENLCKIYGKGENEVRAVDGVSFSVPKGQMVAIVGASGSGKSTLLHMIGAVDRPTSGKIFLDGQDVFEQDEKHLAIFRRRQVGIVYQFYNLLPMLNVRDNITLPLDIDGRPPEYTAIKDLMKSLGIYDKEFCYPHQLSGGQQQRVAIARAVITAPSLLLADEPTGNLDSKNSSEIIDLLRYSNQKYKQTVIIVTHDEKIAASADRIIRLEDGVIVSDERTQP